MRRAAGDRQPSTPDVTAAVTASEHGFARTARDT